MDDRHVPPAADPAAGGALRLVRGPVADPRVRLWRDRPARTAVFAAAAAFALLQCLLAIWVHSRFEGKYHGPFLISTMFGVPAVEAAHDIRPVVAAPDQGWDGQFYYHAACDPLGQNPDAFDHFATRGNASYRYQRIGVPALAWAASRLTGSAFTKPYIYHSVQTLLTAIGFGFLVYLLTAQGVSGWYAVTWLGAGGTLLTLAYGLPDAAGDGVFAACAFAVWTRRLGLY